jgi:cation diffusion facilitator CzcD-associated flavoprotein CzcO
VGAGPSGLAAARALKLNGLDFDVFERHRDVGGIWDMENPGTPMYDSAHFISSRTQSAFDGFPMPDDFADYPARAKILEYIRAFADRYGLRERITFGTDVASASRVGQKWRVTLGNGELREYAGVIAAAGHQWYPFTPEYPGRFTGQAMHSRDYHHASLFDGKRVLVVGAGNSGCDIACDAAARASRAFISMRRGYYFLPKHIFGQPTDAFFRSGPHIPPRIAQPALTLLLRMLVGDLTRYGVPKPDHKVLETHPIVNSQLVHALQHGDITVKPDIAELQGSRVRFTDGSEEEIDLIVFATGYGHVMPFLEAGGVTLGPGASGLWLNVFARHYEDLFVIGLFETDGAAYPMASRQAELVARYLREKSAAPASPHWLDSRRRDPSPDLRGGVRYIATPRHSIYVQFDEYLHYIDRLIKQSKSESRHPGS